MKTFLAIVNPAAGGGKCGKEAPAALQALRDAGLSIDVQETDQKGDATRIAKDAYEKGQRSFIGVGGDGTSYEIINGLFPHPEGDENRPTLGFLPLGTGNSFLRDFTNEGSKYSMNALIKGEERPCDVIRVRHKDGTLYFMNIFSIGFTADVGALRNRWFHRLGEAGYIFSVLAKTAALKPTVIPMKVDADNEKRESVTFISINNSRFTGGKMMMAPHADTADGQADLITAKKMGRPSLIKAFPKIFRGSHVDLPTVDEQRVRKIDFSLDHDVDVMVDGEMIRITPTELEVIPNALTVSV